MTKDKPIVSRTKMPPYALRHLIQRFRVGAPITSEFESALEKNGIRGNDHYKSQKQHWLRWLGEYGGLGAYRRKPGDRSTKFVYNHIQCAPMLLWLHEACGVPEVTLKNAKRVALSAGRSFGSQCAAIRRIVPWEMIERLLRGATPE